MQLVPIDNKDLLNNFTGQQTLSPFLQSWQWGEFQGKMSKIFRLGIEDNGELVAVATLIKIPLAFGLNYFYSPRGPIFKLKVESEKLKIYNYFFNEVAKIAQKEKALFLRFEPNEPTNNFELLTFNFKLNKTIDIQPSKTSILDLTKDEDELLATMHQKTRYNIRLAEKKEVVISENNKEKFNVWWELMNETRQRDGFKLHKKEYYLKMLELPENFLKIFLASYNNRIIAGMMVAFFGDTVTYLHGVSANEDRNVMAPYLLQWYVIKLAKQSGFKYYDFYGIDEEKWPGVTRFKLGFGGREVNYPGTYDLVFDKNSYNVYKFLRKIRRTL